MLLYEPAEDEDCRRGFYRKASDRLVYWDYSAAVDLCGLAYSADVMDIVEWGK